MIVCSTWATSYMIEPTSLGPAGRTVRCARCKAIWFAGGQNPEPKLTAFVDNVIAEAETKSQSPPPQGAPAPPAGKDSGSAPQKPTATPQMHVATDFPPPPRHEDQQPVDQSGPAIADAPSLVPPIEHPPEPEADDDTDGLEQPGASG